MKSLTAIPLILLLAGCQSKSEFDVSPNQVQDHYAKNHSSQPVDVNHLPPGAVKHEKVFHKGDLLPDGTIASGDQKLLTIELKPGSKQGGSPGRKMILSPP